MNISGSPVRHRSKRNTVQTRLVHLCTAYQIFIVLALSMSLHHTLYFGFVLPVVAQSPEYIQLVTIRTIVFVKAGHVRFIQKVGGVHSKFEPLEPLAESAEVVIRSRIHQ